MGHALRKLGFDEHVAASEYIALAQDLAKPNARVTPANKMRLDVLKECTKHLESAQKVERSAAEVAAAEAPMMVQLVHTVPRPSRGPQVDGESSSGPRSPVDSTGVPRPDLGD